MWRRSASAVAGREENDRCLPPAADQEHRRQRGIVGSERRRHRQLLGVCDARAEQRQRAERALSARRHTPQSASRRVDSRARAAFTPWSLRHGLHRMELTRADRLRP